jgi:spore coat polysaccharide biosynthesis protein SpsF
MASLRRLPAAYHVLVTDESSAGRLRPYARRCGFELFVGPKDDVLQRFVRAGRRFGTDEVVRATGDNPLVSWELARLAVMRRRALDADYFGFDGPPLGTGVEVVRFEALERADRETSSAYDREHVTPYLYTHSELFRIVRETAPAAYCEPNARVTLDTIDDYRYLETAFDALYDGNPVALTRLVRWLGESRREGDRAHADASRT